MRPTLEVMRTGPLALVQDLGRVGKAAMGVGRSGAADRSSHSLANRLVANPDNLATIEVTLGGMSFRVIGGDVVVAVTGPIPTRPSMESPSARTVLPKFRMEMWCPSAHRAAFCVATLRCAAG